MKIKGALVKLMQWHQQSLFRRVSFNELSSGDDVYTDAHISWCTSPQARLTNQVYAHLSPSPPVSLHPIGGGLSTCNFSVYLFLPFDVIMMPWQSIYIPRLIHTFDLLFLWTSHSRHAHNIFEWLIYVLGSLMGSITHIVWFYDQHFFLTCWLCLPLHHYLIFSLFWNCILVLHFYLFLLFAIVLLLCRLLFII